MIEILSPAKYRKVEYLTTDCPNCEAVLRLTEEDRNPKLEDNGILCPECGGFISQFEHHVEKIKIERG
jgi:hypothetical protein